MADSLFATVREERRSIRTLTVRVRYNDMGEDQAAHSLDEPPISRRTSMGSWERCCDWPGSGG